jgi:hypothetical protein
MKQPWPAQRCPDLSRSERSYAFSTPLDLMTSKRSRMCEREFSGNRVTVTSPDHRGHRGPSGGVSEMAAAP